MRKPGRHSDGTRDSESPWSQARTSRSGRPSQSNTAPDDRDRPKRQRDEAEAREIRLYGLNACLSAFARRPEALRKVYLVESRIPALKHVLAWCVKNRLGYRVVEDTDLEKLTDSQHHEGVCFEMLRVTPPDLATLIAAQPKAPAPSLLLWLDGVGNPHNLGALLRSAAHFGAAGVIVPEESQLDVSGAAARVAEGAAEIVPIVRACAHARTRNALHVAGYAIAATVPRDGVGLYDSALPARLVAVFGAEGEGMSGELIAAADLRLTIPGTRSIESLNVAASVAVVLGEYWRRHASRASASAPASSTR